MALHGEGRFGGARVYCRGVHGGIGGRFGRFHRSIWVLRHLVGDGQDGSGRGHDEADDATERSCMIHA